MKKKLALALVILLLLVAGSFAWWQYYNSPDKVLADALINSLQTPELAGELDVDSEGLDIDGVLVGNHETGTADIDGEVAINFDDPQVGNIEMSLQMRTLNYNIRTGESGSTYYKLTSITFANPLLQALVGSAFEPALDQWVVADPNQASTDESEGDPFEVVSGLDFATPLANLEGEELQTALESLEQRSPYLVKEDQGEEIIDRQTARKLIIEIDKQGLKQFYKDTGSTINTAYTDEDIDDFFQDEDSIEATVWIDTDSRRFVKVEYTTEIDTKFDFASSDDLEVGEAHVAVVYRYDNLPEIEEPQGAITEVEFERRTQSLFGG